MRFFSWVFFTTKRETCFFTFQVESVEIARTRAERTRKQIWKGISCSKFPIIPIKHYERKRFGHKRERERGESTGRRRKKILEIELWPCKKWMLILHTHTHTHKKSFLHLKLYLFFVASSSHRLKVLFFFGKSIKKSKIGNAPPLVWKKQLWKISRNPALKRF